jgi:hypothetical protein
MNSSPSRLKAVPNPSDPSTARSSAASMNPSPSRSKERGASLLHGRLLLQARGSTRHHPYWELARSAAPAGSSREEVRPPPLLLPGRLRGLPRRQPCNPSRRERGCMRPLGRETDESGQGKAGSRQGIGGPAGRRPGAGAEQRGEARRSELGVTRWEATPRAGDSGGGEGER